MEDVKAAGAHTITTSGIFLKQDKKVESQKDRNKMSEERRGPSREEWNFPQVHRVYVGLAGPELRKGCWGSQTCCWARFSFSHLLTGCPYCYLSISSLSQCLPFSVPSLPPPFPLFSHPECADVCPGKEGINRPRGQAWEPARFPTLQTPPPLLHHLPHDDTAFSFPWWEPRTIVDKAESQTFLLE